MTQLQHNSQEYIKSQIYYAQDNSTARIYSNDICKQELPFERDEAFNEAVDYVTDLLKENYEVGEYEDLGNACSQTWLLKFLNSQFPAQK